MPSCGKVGVRVVVEVTATEVEGGGGCRVACSAIGLGCQMLWMLPLPGVLAALSVGSCSGVP